MPRQTWVQSQVESYQRLKKWYLMPPFLTLRIIRYASRVKWSNPGKGIAPPHTPWCIKLSKREPSGHPRLWSPTLLIYSPINKIYFWFRNLIRSEFQKHHFYFRSNLMIDFRSLQQETFLILHGSQDFVDFIVGLKITLSFTMLLVAIISLRLFSRRLVNILDSWKLLINLQFTFKMSQQFLIILVVIGRLLFNVVTWLLLDLVFAYPADRWR